MTTLRALAARFSSGAASDEVGPLDLALRPGDEATLGFATARAASIAARMCAGIVKPTVGSIYVGDYDTRLQPCEVKRRVGFVDAHGWRGDPHAFQCEIAFRAEVWGIAHAVAERRARSIRDALGPEAGAYGLALALALIAPVELIVLDQPARERYSADVRRIEPNVALLRTKLRVRIEAAPARRATPAP